MLRTGRKGLAAATLLGDMLKGTARRGAASWPPVPAPIAALIAGLGAFLGHVFPSLAGLQGRQRRRDLYRGADRAVLGKRRSCSSGLGAGCRAVALLVAVRA